MFERYYSPEQLETLKERGRQIGAERIAEVEAAWPVLIAEVQAAMDQGADPGSPEVLELARRWKGLVEEFTGGDPGISASLDRMWTSESEIQGIETAPMRGMMEYIGRALEAGQSS